MRAVTMLLRTIASIAVLGVITGCSCQTVQSQKQLLVKNNSSFQNNDSPNYYASDEQTGLKATSKALNPGRGFYKHTETLTSSYDPLYVDELNDYVNEGYTILLRNFVLDTFATSEISSDILGKIDDDFNVIRDARMKVIVRFCYTLDSSGSEWYEADLPILLTHIEQLGDYFRNHQDVILVLQAGFVGVWGEWYYTTHYGNPNTGGPTDEDWEERKQIIETFLDNTPSGIQIQMRTPLIKRTLIDRTTPVTSAEAHGDIPVARLGHHNDCFLASDTDSGTYEDKEEEYEYLMEETQYLAMGGETCNLNPPRSDCEVAQQELSELHYTYLNSGYHPDVLQSWKDQGCYDEISNSLGYRLLEEFSDIPSAVHTSETFTINIQFSNVGYSAPLTSYLPQIILKDDNSKEYLIAQPLSNALFWNPGSTIVLSSDITLDSDFSTGKYKVYLRLIDDHPSLKDIVEYRILLDNLVNDSSLSDRDNFIGNIEVK